MQDRLILFDIDGTLLTMWPVHEKVYESAINEIYGVPNVNFRSFYRPGDTNREVVKMNLEHLGYDAEFIRKGMDRIPEAMVRYYGKYTRPEDITVLPGVLALLGALKEKKIPMGVMTGNRQQTAQILLENAKLANYFPIISSADEGDSRESRLLYAIRRSESIFGMKLNMKNVFYIDDSDHSMPAARKLGIISVAVATGEVPYARLKAANPDYAFTSLRETSAIMQMLESGKGQTKSWSV